MIINYFKSRIRGYFYSILLDFYKENVMDEMIKAEDVAAIKQTMDEVVQTIKGILIPEVMALGDAFKALQSQAPLADLTGVNTSIGNLKSALNEMQQDLDAVKNPQVITKDNDENK